jgi:hypothetical protein
MLEHWLLFMFEQSGRHEIYTRHCVVGESFKGFYFGMVLSLRLPNLAVTLSDVTLWTRKAWSCRRVHSDQYMFQAVPNNLGLPTEFHSLH